MVAVAEKGLTKNQIVAELTRSAHGKIGDYVPIARRGVREDPEFMAHLIAWNNEKGAIRDSKVALPVVALESTEKEFRENAHAHIASLDPRNLIRAIRLAKELKHGNQVRATVEKYLRAREANWSWWERTAVQHRGTLKEAYALCHVKPSTMADSVLFKGVYPKGTIFAAIRDLKDMSDLEAAGTIMEKRIPFLIATGALGSRMKEPALLQALIERMSPTELVTNTKMLERYGLNASPALRATYEKGLEKAAGSKKQAFKATRAAEAVTDARLKEKLHGLQEKQLKTLGGVEGNWLVLGDKSGSMEAAIEVSRVVAATLAKMVKGAVHLVFFDTSPRYIDATGKDYDKLVLATRNVTANGGTSIGCGLQYALERKLDVDGIAIISDSAENSSPVFVNVLKRYAEVFGKTPTVYLYKTHGENTDALERSMESFGEDLQRFDLRAGVDYHSLPNLIATMRTNRYSLIDEIMETPLLTLDEALKKKE